MNVDGLTAGRSPSSASPASPSYYGDKVDDDLIDLCLVEPNNNWQDRLGVLSKRRPLSIIHEESPAFNNYI